MNLLKQKFNFLNVNIWIFDKLKYLNHKNQNEKTQQMISGKKLKILCVKIKSDIGIKSKFEKFEAVCKIFNKRLIFERKMNRGAC